MALITIFTSPKPFTDPHINVIQRNAIRSWLELGDEVEVLLLGDEEGMEEFATEFGVTHIKDIKCNHLGTPLVSSLFDTAKENSSSELLAYVNADIILMPDFVSTALKIQQQQDKFLLVGQRYDLDIRQELDFEVNWKEKIENELIESGMLHAPVGSDYFIYTKNVYKNVPEFTIGRAGWDNWFIYHAVTRPWMAVDATDSIKVIHQNHDYSHLPGSKPHYTQPETFENIRLAGGRKHMYFLYDVDLRIKNGKISRIKMDLFRFMRMIERNIHPSGIEPKGLRWQITLSLKKLQRKLLNRRIK
jgi:hypothetical protein